MQAPIQCRPARAESFAQHLESIDVSFGGLRLRSDEEYRVGAFLRLDIFFAPRAPVTLTAEVVWIEALSKGAHARFDVGLAFVELNNDALKFLMSVLDSEVEHIPAPVDSSVEFNSDEPVSEVRPVTPAPANKIAPDTYAPRVCAPPPARGPDDGDRPTVPPPFDLQAFAHETTARYPEPVAPLQPARRRPPIKKPETQWPSIASALLDAIDVSTGQRKAQRLDDDPVAEMRERFSSGDYAGALAMADIILAAQPNNRLAREFRTNSCAALEDVYAFRLGPLDRVPRVARPPALTDSRSVDHRTGFLLSLIDGVCTLEAIVEACGMPKSDALRILYELVQRGIVAFDPGPS